MGQVSGMEIHGPFGNCIPVRVNQVIKGIEISQRPSHIYSIHSYRNNNFFRPIFATPHYSNMHNLLDNT